MAQRTRRREGLVRAAGGILWRADRDGPKVAVIHRLKHGDWSLPKGKLEPGESFPRAALREVAEETGCRARLREFAGYALYDWKGRDKIVLFWNMTVEHASRFEPNREIDALAWLAPGEALERLDHAHEREVLSAAVAGRLASGDQDAGDPSPAPRPAREASAAPPPATS
jgi:8-oxo-dGTP diphosphatase